MKYTQTKEVTNKVDITLEKTRDADVVHLCINGIAVLFFAGSDLQNPQKHYIPDDQLGGLEDLGFSFEDNFWSYIDNWHGYCYNMKWRYTYEKDNVNINSSNAIFRMCLH